MLKYDREDLIKQLAHHEGVVLKVYKDSLGIDTIGIGRNLAHRGIEVAELAYMQKSMSDIFENGITEEDAYFLANRDIEIVEIELLSSRAVVRELDAIRQRVLVDMGFNLSLIHISEPTRPY